MNVLAVFTVWSYCDHPLWLGNLTVSELIKYVCSGNTDDSTGKKLHYAHCDNEGYFESYIFSVETLKHCISFASHMNVIKILNIHFLILNPFLLPSITFLPEILHSH
jgi:hypothetical protein